MTDRKKMLYVGYICLAVCAGGLAILGWLNLLTPYVILGSIFLIGTGFAFNAPVFSAVVPEIVSNEELPSASILSGLQLNISGIIGPALGGLLLVFVGASTVFALNALYLLAVLISIASWKPKVSKLPSNQVGSFPLVSVSLIQAMPPLARSVWPSIQPPSGPTRNDTVAAISSGVPSRSIGGILAR